MTFSLRTTKNGRGQWAGICKAAEAARHDSGRPFSSASASCGLNEVNQNFPREDDMVVVHVLHRGPGHSVASTEPEKKHARVSTVTGHMAIHLIETVSRLPRDLRAGPGRKQGCRLPCSSRWIVQRVQRSRKNPLSRAGEPPSRVGEPPPEQVEDIVDRGCGFAMSRASECLIPRSCATSSCSIALQAQTHGISSGFRILLPRMHVAGDPPAVAL